MVAPPAHPPPESHAFVVGDADAGARLDRFLASRDLPQSRSLLQRYIAGGHCLVNGAPARPSLRLRPGDRVHLAPPPPEPIDLRPEAIPLAVLHEDDAVVVIDKPAGLLVHPGAGQRHGTLVSALLARCESLSGIGGALRPGIVHRLDRLTSGVMVATKSDAAHAALAAQFKAHTVERRYLAVVAGVVTRPGVFDTLHGRHPVHRKRFTTRVERGRRAVTRYRPLGALRGATVVEAVLETGRTHQVRIHFAEAGHPLLGDPVYGRAPRDPDARAAGRRLGRQALHARLLAFDHPVTGERLRFETDPPADMTALMAALAPGEPGR